MPNSARRRPAPASSAIPNLNSHGTPDALDYRVLEPRVVFDGAGVALVADTVKTVDKTADTHAKSAATDPAHAAIDRQHDALVASLHGLFAPTSKSAAAEIVFVENNLPDTAALLAAVPKGAEVVMLDATKDGVDQIAQYLAGRSGIGAIHILSHGQAGEVDLGTARLTTGLLSTTYAADLAVIRTALAPDADILLYGCDVAQGSAGHAFIQALATATGDNVAASTDITGAAAFGGNWVLEDRIGDVRTAAIDASGWNGELAPLVISAPSQPIVTGNGGVGTTIVWQNAGTIGTSHIDLHATVTSNTTGAAPTFGTASPNGIAPADDPYILLNNWGSVTLHWEIFLAGSKTVRAIGSPTIQTTDIDGIGGSPFTRETVTPSLFHLTSYTLDNPTNLRAFVSGTGVQISGTQDQNAEPTSLASFTWSDVSSWDLTYALVPNAVTTAARTLMDGNGNLTFVDPKTTYMLGIDLDADNSTASGNNYQATYSGTPVGIVDSDVTITEHSALGTTVDSASVILTNAQSGDRLSIAGSTAAAGLIDGLDYLVSSSNGQISIALSGNAPVATYQAALQAITFDNTQSLPSGADRLVTVSVTNATFGTTSNEALATIHVPVNDPPVNTLAASYTVNEDTSLNLTGISVTDPDAGAASISVDLKVGSGNLTLLTNVTGGVAAAQVSGNGSGDITITAPLSAINATLAAFSGLKFIDTLNHNGAVTLTMTTDDRGNSGLGGAMTDVDARTITVVPVNDPPVANDDTFTTDQGVAVIIPVKLNDSDIDSPTLTVTKINSTAITAGSAAVAVANGSVKLLADGTLQFAPAAGYFGPIAFAYTLSDGALTDTANVTGTVTSVPTAVDDAFFTTQDTPITVAVLANDVDSQGYPLTITQVDGHAITAGDPSGVGVTGGTVTLDATGRLTYAPDAGYLGTPSFNYTIDDGHGRADTATVNGSVTPLNHAPVNIVPDTQVAIDGAVTFSTANGNAVQVTDDAAATQIIQTTVMVDAGTLTLKQTTGLTFVKGDGTADATITIQGTKAAINAALDGMKYIAAVGAGGTAHLTITTDDLGHPNGEDIPNGSFETTLTPVANGTYKIINQSQVPGWQTTATDHMIEIWGTGFLGVPAYEGNHFAELNANQVAADYNTSTIPKGQPLTFSFAHRGRSGVDVMNVQVVDAGADGVFGTADDTTLMNQNYSDGNSAWGFYQKDLGAASGNPVRLIFNSVSSVGGASVGNFLDAVHLGTAHLTDTDTVAITLNRPPVAVDDRGTVNEDASVILPVRANDSDPDGNAITVTAVTQGIHGAVSIDPVTGNPVYTPAANYTGTDTFTYTISDGNGGTATATVTVTIVPVNDAPAAADKAITTLEDTPVTLAASDFGFSDPNDTPANSLLAVKIVTLPTNGTLTDNGVAVTAGQFIPVADITSGKLVFMPDANANGSAYANFTFQVQDNGGTANGGVDLDPTTNAITFNVTPVNDPPVPMPDTASGTEDTTLTVDAAHGLLANDTDVDGGPLSVTQYTVAGLAGSFAAGTKATIPNVGALIINADGSYTFKPVADYNGAVPVATYTVSDGAGGFATSTLAITIAPVADITADNVVAQQDGSVTFNALTGTNGATADTFEGTPSVTAVSTPGHGSVGFDATGRMTYTPAAGYHGTDTFTYTVTSPVGVIETATITVTVNAPPEVVVSLGDKTGPDGSPVSIITKGAFADPEGQPLKFAASGLPAGLSIDPNTGRITGILDHNASIGGATGNGEYLVAVTATDPLGGSVTDNFVFRADNVAPVAANDLMTTPEKTPVTGNVLADNGNGPDHDGGLDTDILKVGGVITGTAAPIAGAGIATAVAGDHGGSFTVQADGSFSFDPGHAFDDLAAGQTRTTTVTYMIYDGNGGTARAALTVTVTGVNDAPALMPDTNSLAEDTTLTVLASPTSGLLANDTDVDGGLLSVTQYTVAGLAGTFAAGTKATIPNIGALTINADGSYTFKPVADYYGAVPVATYTVSDGNPGGISTSTLSLTVTPVNDPPIVSLSASNGTNLLANGGFEAGSTGWLSTPSAGLSGPLSFVNVNSPLTIGAAAASSSGGVRIYTDTLGATGPGHVLLASAAPVTLTNGATYDFAFDAQSTPNGQPNAGNFTWVVLDAANNVVMTLPTGAFTTGGAGTDPAATLLAANTWQHFEASFASGLPTGAYSIGMTWLTPPATNGNARDLNIDRVYLAPIIANFDYTTTFTENGAPVSIADATRSVTDVDNATMQSATIMLTDAQASDLLAAGAIPAGITASAYDPATHAITLSGSATKADYATAIQAITFANSSDNPSAADRHVAVTVNDGALASNTAVATIHVIPVNDPPVAADDTAAVSEDGPAVTGNVITGKSVTGAGADTDVDGGPLKVTGVRSSTGTAVPIGVAAALPEGGTLTLNPDGSYSFDPGHAFQYLALNETKDVVVHYTIDDGAGGTATADLRITVTGANDAPIVVDPATGRQPVDPVTGTRLDPAIATIIPAVAGSDGSPIAPVKVAPYFADPDQSQGAPKLSVDITALPAGITFDPATGTFSGAPSKDASQGHTGNDPAGTYKVPVTATDPLGAKVTTYVTFNITNPPPVAADDLVTTPENTPLAGSVLTNDHDGGLDTDTLKVGGVITGTATPIDGAGLATPVAGDHGGAFTVQANGQYTFDPGTAFDDLSPGETRKTTVTYKVYDGNGGTATAALTVTVTGVNDAPIVIDPATGMPPVDPVTGTPLDPATATIIPAVAGADGSPITPVKVTGFVKDVDISQGPPKLSVDITTLPAGITFDPATGTFSGAPSKDASQGHTGNDPAGTYKVPVTATDPLGAKVTTYITFTITNPPPVAVDDLTDTADKVPLTGNVLTNDHDGGLDTDTLKVGGVITGTATPIDGAGLATSVAGDHGGSFTMQANGQYTFDSGTAFVDLAQGEMRKTTVTYKIYDGNGGTATAALTVTVTGVNDAPIVIDPATGKQPADAVTGKPLDPATATIIPAVSGSDGSPITPIKVAPYFADPDLSQGAPKLSVDITALPAGITFDPATGTFSGAPLKDASQGHTGNDPAGTYKVPVTATDSLGAKVTTYVTFKIANVPPVAVDDGPVTTTENIAIKVPVLANDHDGGLDTDLLRVIAASSGQGQVVINADGTITFTPKAGFVGAATVTYVITDDNGGTATAKVSVVVKPQIMGQPATPTPNLPARPADQSSPLHVEGAVIAAVNGGTGIAELGGEPSLLGTGGAVHDISARVAGLWPATIGDAAVGGFGAWSPVTLVGSSRQLGALLGTLDAGHGAQIMVQSSVHDGVLSLTIEEIAPTAGRHVVDYRVLRADGRALPDWMERPSLDLLRGRRAADSESVDLTITAVYSDGTQLTQSVRVHTSTGVIEPLPGRRAELAPKLFADQFAAQASLTAAQSEALASVLEWTR